MYQKKVIMTLAMLPLQVWAVLRSKSYHCHWFQQENIKFVYSQDYVFRDILTLACFTGALESSYPDPISLCCTANPVAATKSSEHGGMYRKIRASQQAGEQGESQLQLSASHWHNILFVIMLIQSG